MIPREMIQNKGSPDTVANESQSQVDSKRGKGDGPSYIAQQLWGLAIPIESVNPDPSNARKHDEKNLDAIKASLSRFGQRSPIIVQREGMTVRAGNGRLLAAKSLGWKQIAAVVVDESSIDAVAFAIADNRTAELATWDNETLAQLLDTMPKDVLGATGFSDKDLADLLDEIRPEVVEDEVPEPPVDPISKPGDLWLLDGHRLLCGDSTKAEDVARVLGDAVPLLMVTDPPYGVEYDPTWRDEAGGQFGDGKTVMRGKVENDDRIDWSPAWALFPGNVSYVWHAGIYAGEVAVSLLSATFHIRAQVVWRKPHFIMGRGSYHWQHEPCWYAVRKGKTAKWCGDRSQSTIWDIAGMNPAGGNREEKLGHGTQKPLECMARPIRNHEGDVYDPFLGSGTTLIAAEQLGRKCYGIEISPAYCDVIVQRWEKLTSKKAVLESR